MGGRAVAPRVPACGLLVGVICAAFLGCVGVRPSHEVDPAGSIIVAPIDLGGRTRSAYWYLPAGETSVLVVFEHGFLRHCENLRETSRRLVAAGAIVLCVEASMRGGDPALAETLARALVDLRVAPDGRALPARIVVAGHSAGALFAVRMGEALDAIASERLVGALLFDPVSGEGFEAGLGAISAAGRRPILALLAPPHRCNADSNASPALGRLEQDARDAGSSAFVVIRLGDGATHADVEGEDTSGIAEWSCGRVRSDVVEAVRALAIDWVRRVAGAPVEGRGEPESKGARRLRDEPLRFSTSDGDQAPGWMRGRVATGPLRSD